MVRGTAALQLATGIAFGLVGCSRTGPTHDEGMPDSTSVDAIGALVLSYGDFGPQAASHELIGYSWYQ